MVFVGVCRKVRGKGLRRGLFRRVLGMFLCLFIAEQFEKGYVDRLAGVEAIRRTCPSKGQPVEPAERGNFRQNQKIL